VIGTSSREETVLLGERIGRALKAGDVVALSGELGAGKTTLIQGIAKGLGIKDWVTSPTFTIINEFKGAMDLYHMDLYRIDAIDEAFQEEMEEYFKKGGVAVIEWAEKARDILPEGTIEINMKILSENKRKIEIKGIKIGSKKEEVRSKK
jgi:tRNA threonylcarbamoyladenosine biosynthesis protein TsaE